MASLWTACSAAQLQGALSYHGHMPSICTHYISTIYGCQLTGCTIILSYFMCINLRLMTSDNMFLSVSLQRPLLHRVEDKVFAKCFYTDNMFNTRLCTASYGKYRLFFFLRRHRNRLESAEDEQKTDLRDIIWSLVIVSQRTSSQS